LNSLRFLTQRSCHPHECGWAEQTVVSGPFTDVGHRSREYAGSATVLIAEPAEHVLLLARSQRAPELRAVPLKPIGDRQVRVALSLHVPELAHAEVVIPFGAGNVDHSRNTFNSDRG
jgi:hypothetical protein